MSASVGIFIIAVGAIMRFALQAGSPLGINLHIVGIILMLAGVLRLLLPGSMRARLNPGFLRIRWVSPGEPQGYDGGPADAHPDARLEEFRRDAAEDVSGTQADEVFLSPDAPGRQLDEL